MTLRCITGGRIVDPGSDQDAVGDLWFRGDRIVPEPAESESKARAERVDASGCLVMAGAIDIHTHVVGANVSAARLLLPERFAHLEDRLGTWTGAPWDLKTTGELYAQMGFTTVVEPAVAPTDAVAVHAELELIPYVDKACLAVLGNEDVLLGLLRDGAGQSEIRDYVGWLLSSTRALGAKSINPGGVASWKHNIRTFAIDDIVPEYGVSPRKIGASLQESLHDLGVPHPLHLHTQNLGLPGNVHSAAEAIRSAEGRPLHLAHLQFYAYDSQGSFGMSSGATMLAELLSENGNVTADVGQVMFGPTVTISADTPTQFQARGRAQPNKWRILDGDGNGGGVVPHDYRSTSRTAALQWAIGLELFLLVKNPHQIYLTTDHPNGGPFTSYPELIGLLMHADKRREIIEDLPAEAMEVCNLREIDREYTLQEIAIMTRQAPAELLGLADRGQLRPGAIADIAIYPDLPDRTDTFRRAKYVFKNGRPIVVDSKLGPAVAGRTLTVAPEYDASIKTQIGADYEKRFGASPDSFAVPEFILNQQKSPFEVIPCHPN